MLPPLYKATFKPAPVTLRIRLLPVSAIHNVPVPKLLQVIPDGFDNVFGDRANNNNNNNNDGDDDDNNIGNKDDINNI